MNNLDCSSDHCVKKLVEKYDVVGQIDLRSVESINHYHLQLQIKKLWKEQFQEDQRIIIGTRKTTQNQDAPGRNPPKNILLRT
jgi:hypothetical protein